MNTKEALIAARELIAKPGAWCQGHYAIDSDLMVTDPSGGDACSWCPLGALGRVTTWRGQMDAQPDAFLDASDRLSVSAGAQIVRWNDDGTRTQAEVIALFDQAIETCK